jgi:hypothetical protein
MEEAGMREDQRRLVRCSATSRKDRGPEGETRAGAVNVWANVSGAAEVMNRMRECTERTEKMEWTDDDDLFGSSTTMPYPMPPLFPFHTFHVA